MKELSLSTSHVKTELNRICAETRKNTAYACTEKYIVRVHCVSKRKLVPAHVYGNTGLYSGTCVRMENYVVFV